MPLTSPQPGEEGALAAGPIQQAKPQAFIDFENWVNADPSRLTALIDGIDDQGRDLGSDANFWHNSPINKADTDHFLADWIGGGYWTGRNNKGQRLYKTLRSGVSQAAALARDNGNAKIRMELMLSGADDVSWALTQVDGDVVLRIITPRI